MQLYIITICNLWSTFHFCWTLQLSPLQFLLIQQLTHPAPPFPVLNRPVQANHPWLGLLPTSQFSLVSSTLLLAVGGWGGGGGDPGSRTQNLSSKILHLGNLISHPPWAAIVFSLSDFHIKQ